MRSRLFLLGLPLIFLLIIPHSQSAFAWDFGSLGLFNPTGADNAYYHGQQDAQYDHTQGLVYNPYPQCCHSQIYNDDFKNGYDANKILMSISIIHPELQ